MGGEPQGGARAELFFGQEDSNQAWEHLDDKPYQSFGKLGKDHFYW